MNTKRKDRFELFHQEYQDIEVVFPLIIKHKSKNVEIIHENGVREMFSVSTRNGTTGYSRIKYKVYNKEEFLFFCKRQMYISKNSWGSMTGTQEDVDNITAEIERVNQKMFECPAEQSYESFDSMPDNEEQAIGEIINTQENAIFQKPEEDAPF